MLKDKYKLINYHFQEKICIPSHKSTTQPDRGEKKPNYPQNTPTHEQHQPAQVGEPLLDWMGSVLDCMSFGTRCYGPIVI